jgi:hypothetical protein
VRGVQSTRSLRSEQSTRTARPVGIVLFAEKIALRSALVSENIGVAGKKTYRRGLRLAEVGSGHDQVESSFEGYRQLRITAKVCDLPDRRNQPGDPEKAASIEQLRPRPARRHPNDR